MQGEHELKHLEHALLALTEAINGHNKTTEILHRIEQMEIKIMATQAEIAAQIRNQTIALNKIGNETDKLKTLIKDLQAAVDNQSNASPELEAATDALVAQVKAVDDKVPDEVPVPPVV